MGRLIPFTWHDRERSVKCTSHTDYYEGSAKEIRVQSSLGNNRIVLPGPSGLLFLGIAEVYDSTAHNYMLYR
jgi:hypothetical protein